MSDGCPLCDGAGGWADDIAERSVLCPICRAEEARERELRHPFNRLNQLDLLPCKFYGPRFQAPPWLLVIHSGSRSANVAEYLHAFDDAEAARRGTKVSCHVSWSGTRRRFVQQVLLDRAAWHCGGSRLAYRDRVRRRLNFCSIGIELPGPWDKRRSQSEMSALRNVVALIVTAVPSLQVVVGHSEIDPRKKDPGPHMDWGALGGLGLIRPV